MSTPFWAPPPEKYPGRLPDKADVLVIGGGIAGTSLLWHLARRRIDAVLVERHHIAWGASGRNAGFLPAGHGMDPAFVFEYIRGPYEPFETDRFTYTREWTANALQTVIDMQGRYGEVIRKLNMPTSYVILDRVVWGLSALLGRLEATNNWRGILQEYRKGAPPCTPLGEDEASWHRAAAAHH